MIMMLHVAGGCAVISSSSSKKEAGQEGEPIGILTTACIIDKTMVVNRQSTRLRQSQQ